MTSQAVWALAPANAEWQAVIESEGLRNVRLLSSVAELPRLMRTCAPPDCFIWALNDRDEHEVERAVHLLSAASGHTRHLFRVSMTARTAALLFSLVPALPTAIVSLRGQHSLSLDIRALIEARAPRADGAIISTLARYFERYEPHFAANAAVASILVGRRCANVSQLARVLHISVRRLRDDLHAACGLEPRTLLRWAFVLHCVTEADKHCRPLKAIAADAGYRSSEALTNKMARLCGIRIREVLRRGGSERLVAQFADMLKPLPVEQSSTIHTPPRGSVSVFAPALVTGGTHHRSAPGASATFQM